MTMVEWFWQAVWLVLAIAAAGAIMDGLGRWRRKP